MKPAICISGLCRGNADRNIARIQKIFPDIPVFLSTWSGCALLDGYDVKEYPEPSAHYHPVLDVLEPCPTNKFDVYTEKCKKDQEINKWMLHAAKQIVGHAYVVDDLPNEYDMIIRTRYDVVVSDVVDFSPLLTASYDEKRAIGFATRNSTFSHNELVEITERHSKDWHCYIADAIIMHRRDMFNTKQVCDLFNEKRLWGCEWGWYQTLSRPYGNTHRCFRGGVKLEKQL